mgnify:CR=1 FL=1
MKRVFWRTYLCTQAQQYLGREKEKQRTTVIVKVRRLIPLVRG